MKVAVIYLGSNNLLSLISVLEYLGVNYEIIKKNRKRLNEFSHIILPGVGNYDYIVNQIEDNFNRNELIRLINSKPTLGICIGMQILGKSSAEGRKFGLGIFEHTYVQLHKKNNQNNKVPNTGYREVIYDNKISIFKGINSGSHFYFNHSFALKKFSKEKNFKFTTTSHNYKFISAFQKNKIFGTQFHPEKSKAQGVKLIANFLELK